MVQLGQLVGAPLSVLGSAVARVRDRAWGGLKVHVDDWRMANVSAIMIESAWVENTSSQNNFVEDFDVEVLEPTKAGTASTEWRQPYRPVRINRGANVPAFGRTSAIAAIVHLDSPMPAIAGTVKIAISALGRRGFRNRPSVLETDYDLTPTG